MSYMTLFSQEKPLFQKEKFLYDTFFTLFTLSRASDNTTSQNIGGTDAWAVPHLKCFWGDHPPAPHRSPPLSLAQNIELHVVTNALSSTTIMFVPDTESKYRIVRLNTGHLATL